MSAPVVSSPTIRIDVRRLRDALTDLNDGEFDIDVRAAIVAVTSSFRGGLPESEQFPQISPSEVRDISSALNNMEGHSYQRLALIRSTVENILARP